MTLRGLALSFGLIIGLSATVFFFRYGTLSPCQALAKQGKQHLLKETLTGLSGSPWEQAGRTLGLALGGPLVDQVISALTPWQCVQGLVRWETRRHWDSTGPAGLSSTPIAPSTVPTPTWVYDEHHDKMGRGLIRTATIQSLNEVTFGFPYTGPQRASLMLRIHPSYGKDIILRVQHGQFLCRTSDCKVALRFDDGKPQTYEGSKPSDDGTTTLFIRGYDAIAPQLSRAKMLRIEAQFYQEGARVFEFPVVGLNWTTPNLATGKKSKP